jgi:hypothetical protein
MALLIKSDRVAKLVGVISTMLGLIVGACYL